MAGQLHHGLGYTGFLPALMLETEEPRQKGNDGTLLRHLFEFLELHI